MSDRFSTRWRTMLLAYTACAIAVGCGDGRPTRVPVSGKVLIDGQPLSGGFIRFVPSDARPSGSKIDKNGLFTLTCYDGGDGAVPGTHRIEVSANQPLSDTKIRWLAPKKYASFKTSELVEKITDATDSLVIELTWDGGKPYVEVKGG